MNEKLSGVLTALTTPFDDHGALDEAALGRLIEHNLASGVDGVVVAGSTGEVGALTTDEQLRLIDVTVERVAGRVPVVAQTGATSTAGAIRLSQAAQTYGADVIMPVTPYYEPLSLDETVRYLEDVSSAVDLPVMLYNIPAATGVNLDPDTVRGLATGSENIQYIKDSSANWEQALRLIHYHGDVVDTFIGWDVYAYSALVEGAAGVVAGTANVVPSELVAVCRAIAQGDLGGARELWRRVYPVIDTLLNEPFIAAVKAGVGLRGEPVGVPRQPVAPLAPDAFERVKTAMQGLDH